VLGLSERLFGMFGWVGWVVFYVFRSKSTQRFIRSEMRRMHGRGRTYCYHKKRNQIIAANSNRWITAPSKYAGIEGEDFESPW
jgi:hypothetical protein